MHVQRDAAGVQSKPRLAFAREGDGRILINAWLDANVVTSIKPAGKALTISLVVTRDGAASRFMYHIRVGSEAQATELVRAIKKAVPA